MPFTTTVLDNQNERVFYTLSEATARTLAGERTQVMLSIEGRVVGVMLFSIKPDYLYIHRMGNDSVNSDKPYRHVGTLLFEYAFRKSLNAKKWGRIELDACGTSPAAWFKIGFRKKSQSAVFLEKVLSNYTKKPSRECRLQIMLDKPWAYQNLVENAAAHLNEEADYISFEQAIQYGICDYEKNKTFELKLKKTKKLTVDDCYPVTGTMYLPPKIIELKKYLFSKITPIGSEICFSYASVMGRLKNPALKKLVTQGKLDASNALEIEAKTPMTRGCHSCYQKAD